ncbi:MAG: 4-oxalocrotonate tautomerase family protein [Candidatus Margulisiibacteriota bacterium]
MPYIDVKVAGKLTREQKEEISKDICDSLERVANKSRNSVYIVFDEVERENWAVGEKLLG